MSECDEIVHMSNELSVDKENINKRSYIGFSQGEMGKKDSVDDSSYGDSLNCQIEDNALPLESRNVFDMSPIY